MFDDLVNTQQELLNATKANVDAIIESKMRNVYEIEKNLDTLLDLSKHFGEAVDTFIRLCDYYKTIDFESACDYLEYLKDCFENEEEYYKHLKRVKGLKNEV